MNDKLIIKKQKELIDVYQKLVKDDNRIKIGFIDIERIEKELASLSTDESKGCVMTEEKINEIYNKAKVFIMHNDEEANVIRDGRINNGAQFLTDFVLDYIESSPLPVSEEPEKSAETILLKYRVQSSPFTEEKMIEAMEEYAQFKQSPISWVEIDREIDQYIKEELPPLEDCVALGRFNKRIHSRLTDAISDEEIEKWACDFGAKAFRDRKIKATEK